MPCCKCEEHQWHGRPLDMAYKDEAGREFCLFHAPAKHKGMSVDGFNAQVFERIYDFKAKTKTDDADKLCNLSGTIFPGDISFGKYDADNPLPWISFRQATFSGKASFLTSTFSGEANFWGTTFNGEALFLVAKFMGEANFGGATFSGQADFIGAWFSGKAVFWRVWFSGEANFWGTIFIGEANFEELKAEKNALRLHSLSKETLSNLSFTSMDTECFSFKGCDWPEKLWLETQEEPDYKACEELYRSLKQKAASEHDQPLVSKWHYREKLMALEQLKAARGWRGRLGLTGLYYWCSGFGEDPAQAFRVLAGLLGFALLALSGFKLWETGPGNHQLDLGRILEIPAELLALIPFVKTEAKALASASGVLTPVKAIVTSLLHILLAAQIALFAFALRNRFRR